MTTLTDEQFAFIKLLPEAEYQAVRRLGLAQQARYAAMRLDGQSHNFADMIASRGFPGVRTDSEFNKGRCNGNQFEEVPGLGDHLKALAEANGISTNGKYYCHGLAEYPGDPDAWVSGRGDVVEIARRKGMKVSGSVEYTPEERAPMGDCEIAPDLVDREVDHVMAMDGGFRREDVAERVRDLRAGRVDINPLLVDEAA